MGFYGGDSCRFASVPCGPYSFYGKPTGFGTTPAPACRCPECLGSGAVPFSLWTLHGPGLTPAGSGFGSFGQSQAAAAVNEWYTDPDALGLTIFFDVETASGGWGGDTASNRAVLEGALSYVADHPQTFTAGIYISVGKQDNKWDAFFGKAYKTRVPFVLWAALHLCCTCQEAAEKWPDYGTGAPIQAGGQKIVVAQYSISPPCGPADLDYMVQDPSARRFNPETLKPGPRKGAMQGLR